MRKSLVIIILLGAFTLFLSRCINNQVEPGKDPRGNVYAGAATCRQCHQAIYDSFLSTAHFRSTSNATADNILGSFNGKNDGFIYDSVNKVMMEKRDSGYFQVLYKNGKEAAAYPFDILFGFRNAQTALYWNNDQPHELPVSHFSSVNAWATSPGFPSDHPKFDRYVGTECLDCHSSGINIKTNRSVLDEERLDRSTLIYGIDCERCHGPALNHVNYHLANPGEKVASYLVKNSQLGRQQKLDACAVCHSGNDQTKIQSRFLFKPGDTLGYFFLPKTGDNVPGIDVHGNQYRLLAQSKCFRGTTITCGTCHDPHKNASNDLAIYSRQCMSCHKPEASNFCPQYAALGETIKSNCIDCHMPKQASQRITYKMKADGEAASYLLRTHRIAVYEDSAAKAH